MRTTTAAALGVLLGFAVVHAYAADSMVVHLVDNRFEPTELVLEHGKAYRLRVENAGKELHQFKAAAFFRAARISQGRDALTPDGAEVVVQPGQAKELELVAPAPGRYELTCPDHDWDGMVGKIVVR